ncbi:hypothetical protein [Mycolicibacterium neoaurum]|uniref:hypothetical protein n=1 Tax=Mycolicibacterium neoaurum TaxID=1795 RepID=UPI00248CAEF8|nr:hypothetical protein [Mycolicibacterium neoaurum]WBP93359.1 hypothetical protein O7W24_19645 [Mycolicibacterium neoaurum]
MTRRYRGLTWNHPRGTDALRAALDEPGAPACHIEWDAQSLEGFESAPVARNAATYDLLVLDHPHIGEALAQHALRPLEELFEPAELDRWRKASVGRSFESYAAQGKTWALPLDAATQVSALADPALPVPDTWEQAVTLAREVPSVLPTTGPHLFLTLCAMAVAHGEEPGGRGSRFLSTEAVAEALSTIAAFVDVQTDGPHVHNPITVLDAMSRPGGPVYCPHVYGYVNYSQGAVTRPVSFHDAPQGRSGRRGSVLGGTGIAVSARCEPDAALRDHIRWLMSESAQRDFIPRHAGQPSAIAAWRDPDLNAAARQFYVHTHATITDAWIRPRHDGAIAFQRRAAHRVREAVFWGGHPQALADELTELYQSCRSGDEMIGSPIDVLGPEGRALDYERDR